MKYVYESERIGFIKLEEKYKLDYIRMYLDKRIQEKIFKKFYNEEQISKWVEKLINENNNNYVMIEKNNNTCIQFIPASKSAIFSIYFFYFEKTKI